MRVLVAPQEFKESLTAREVSTAIERGIQRVHPEWEINTLPMSDGGPGFLDIVNTHISSTLHQVQVHNAAGNVINANYLGLNEKSIALIEAAQANGIALISPHERNPITATSAGVGDLITVALKEQYEKIVIGVGGSASTDGGIGMANTLGAQFLDKHGNSIASNASELYKLDEIKWHPSLTIQNTSFQVVSDVKNPLLGPMGAATIFGPQKGATSEQIPFLEAGLTQLKKVIQSSLGIDVSTLEGGAGAGGLAAGLVAFLGADIQSGFNFVADTIKFEKYLKATDVVITGEGRYDDQSANGKTTGHIKKLCKKLQVPCILFVGETISQDKDVWTLTNDITSKEDAMHEAPTLLEKMARKWAENYKFKDHLAESDQ
jgi:glycerate kinase